MIIIKEDMKKLFFAMACVAAMCFAACNSNNENAADTTSTDTAAQQEQCEGNCPFSMIAKGLEANDSATVVENWAKVETKLAELVETANGMAPKVAAKVESLISENGENLAKYVDVAHMQELVAKAKEIKATEGCCEGHEGCGHDHEGCKHEHKDGGCCEGK